MKNLITISLLLASTFLSAQTLKKTYYDYYNKVVNEVYYVNSAGYGHGAYKKYDQKGALIYKGNYVNGAQDGLWTRYSTYTGKLEVSESETYKDGVLNGPAKYYGTLDGRNIVIKEGEYLNGEKHGKWMFLDPYSNYKLTTEQKKLAQYIKSYPVFDKGQFNYPDGELNTHYFPSGKIRSIQNFKGGKKVGNQIWYLPDGTVDYEEFFEDLEAIREQFKDSALTAFKNLDFELAANYFSKMKNQDDYNSMVELSEVKKLVNQEKYKDAIKGISRVMNKISNSVITEYYNSIYEKFIIQLDPVLMSYANIGDTVGLEKELSSQGNIFKDQEYDKYILLLQQTKARSKKQGDEIKALDNKINSAFKDYTIKNRILQQPILRYDDDGSPVYSESYPRGEFFYKKSKIIVDQQKKEYANEKEFEKKRQLANTLIATLDKLNKYTDKECKSLNKDLKKVEGQPEIKTILGL